MKLRIEIFDSLFAFFKSYSQRPNRGLYSFPDQQTLVLGTNLPFIVSLRCSGLHWSPLDSL